MRRDRGFLSKQGIAHHWLPHILPLTFKLFFIFTEVSQGIYAEIQSLGRVSESPFIGDAKKTIICPLSVSSTHTAQRKACLIFISDNSLVVLLVASSGLTGGLAAPLVAAGAATIIGSAGAAALGSTAGIAVMASLFGAAGAGLTGKRVTAHFSATEAQARVCKHRANNLTELCRAREAI